ncbi:MAG: hypothetical protein NVSMB1_16790 [Polyangiales bacterium]
MYGFWPAASDGDDLVLFAGQDGADGADRAPDRELQRFHMLRQQQKKTDDKPYVSLADFVAPLALRTSRATRTSDTGLAVRDHVGAFAVTAGIGVEEMVAHYRSDHDDYSAIIVKALADRLAEAFAELLHQRVRREWGYGASESLTHEDLIAESYRGIRPAFGYPACPDHTEKRALFELLDAPLVGITLTEHFAMLPAASVSGLYFAHPEARYFAIGRIGRDQVEAYASRKNMSMKEAERWLGPSLGYDPMQSPVQPPPSAPTPTVESAVNATIVS